LVFLTYKRSVFHRRQDVLVTYPEHRFEQDHSEQFNNKSNALYFHIFCSPSPSLFPFLLSYLLLQFSPLSFFTFLYSSLFLSSLLSSLFSFFLPFHHHFISADTSIANVCINSSRNSRPMFSVCIIQIHYKNYCRKIVLILKEKSVLSNNNSHWSLSLPFSLFVCLPVCITQHTGTLSNIALKT
jgi:hypothetical protein